MKLCMNLNLRAEEQSYCLQLLTGYLRLTLVFMWDGALREGFNFCFARTFILALTKLSFWQGDWALSSHFVGFRHFPHIS